MGITIYDVAEQAGVSHTTVSNVINARTGAIAVSPRTRKRVWAAIRKTGYEPSFAARALALKRTDAIGCLVSPQVGVFTNSFFREVFAGVEQTVLASDWSLLIDSVDRRCATGPSPRGAAMPMRLETDGYLVFASSRGTDLSPLSPKPIVLVECEATGDAHSRVIVNNAQGARLAIDHLCELGHRRIGVLRGAKGNFSADRRFAAMKQRLAEMGFALPAKLYASNHGNPETGFASACKVMKSGLGFTALAAFNDGAAVGAIRALREAGVRVPQDVSVTGFDGVPLLREVDAPLTTVHVPTQDLGRTAAGMLIDRLRSGGKASTSPSEVVVDVSLTPGATTAKAGRGWKMR